MFKRCTIHKPLPLAFFCLVLPCITFGLLATSVFAHGNARDRKGRGQQIERTVSADARVSVSACTLSGSFTVHGWNRKEVRVRVSSGANIELTRIDQTTSQLATELKVTAQNRRGTGSPSCLMFGDLEMDVPLGASVKLQTTSGDISATDVARVDVTTTSGSISLAKMGEDTNATVIGGDITVRDSTGSFKLQATGGSIDARDVAPVTATDALNVSTVSGEVTLNQVQHRHVSVNSVSGEVMYSGALLPNGRYSFQNLSGEVQLLLPASSSFRLLANVGESVKISSDFALKYTQNPNMVSPGNRSEPRHVNATVGDGESTVRVSLLTGSLRISKK
jgi:hypothetical protein